MTIVEQRDGAVISARAACDALDVSRASLYRRRRPPSPPKREAVCAPNPRRLDDAERQKILDTLHLPEFADQPPTDVYAALLGRGTCLGSIRTMYRVLAPDVRVGPGQPAVLGGQTAGTSSATIVAPSKSPRPAVTSGACAKHSQRPLPGAGQWSVSR